MQGTESVNLSHQIVHANPSLSGFGRQDAHTMSSLEIAELTAKRHQDVLRDIRNMLESLDQPFAQFCAKVPSDGGRPTTVANLPRRECLILVSGYNVELRAKIIDRWEELETQARAIDPMQALNDPSMMRGLLLTYSEKVLALEGHVAEMEPTVEAFERIAAAEGSFCITDAAKTLQTQPKVVFAFLRSHRWIYTRAGGNTEIAYQDKLATGLLSHKTTTVERSDGSEKVITQVRVTPKGLARLAKELGPGFALV